MFHNQVKAFERVVTIDAQANLFNVMAILSDRPHMIYQCVVAFPTRKWSRFVMVVGSIQLTGYCQQAGARAREI